VLAALTRRYRRRLAWCLRHRVLTISAAGVVLALTLLLVMSGVVGSEFLPHLDEAPSGSVARCPPALVRPRASG
jgi:cobalt-zinc-cadmium resistance protein CzcA